MATTKGNAQVFPDKNLNSGNFLDTFITENHPLNGFQSNFKKLEGTLDVQWSEYDTWQLSSSIIFLQNF